MGEAGPEVVTKRAEGAGGGARIRREAEVLAQLRHPGVVELVSAELDGPEPALVVRHVGPSLGRCGPYRPEETAALLAALATTAADLHDLGVVHGAISPEHVLVAADGRPVLCGFSAGGRVGQLPVLVPELPPGFADPDRRATDRLHPAVDVHGLGALTRFLAVQARGHGPGDRAGRAVTAALLKIAAEATAPDPTQRPTARQVATSVHQAAPHARLPVLNGGPAEPDTATAMAADAGEGAGPRHDPASEASQATAPMIGDDKSTTMLSTRRTALAGRRRPSIVALARGGSGPAFRSPDNSARRGRRRRWGAARLVAVGAAGAIVVSAGVALRLSGAHPPEPDGPPTTQSAESASARAPSTDGAVTTAEAPEPSSSALAGPGAATAEPLGPAPWLPSVRAACPAIEAVLAADVDDDGCADAVTHSEDVVAAAGRRWSVGAAGDVIATGDWACDGRRTLAVLRPATGHVFRFDGWALPGEELPATLVAAVNGAVGLRTADIEGDGCHELIVDREGEPPSLLELDGK